MSVRPTTPEEAERGAHDLDVPVDPIVARIHAYWDGKRGQRRMPSRADIDPAELGRLVPHVMIYDVEEPEKLYRIRLVGGVIVDFYGFNTTGQLAGACMPPASAAQMHEILSGVEIGRAPRFRAGFAHWNVDKSYRRFEACFLPLSPDDDRVDKIFVGIAFDTTG
ncbi:MAG TPA: PAS domain-containing protein [Stellaceae bacterium]|nr:PAS domain-containing protein [Stellaceae bacterium]